MPEFTPQTLSIILPRDITPPTTTLTITPARDANGWNRTNVDVILNATDDISGVAPTEITVDGLCSAAYTAPVLINAEGIHDVGFHSIDRSQNVEAEKHQNVRIDKPAPEVVISYDPQSDAIVIEGRDVLSGTDAGPVAPKTRTGAKWTDFGSDVAEIRIYPIEDRAGNLTTLYLKVRCSPLAIEASVLGIACDDQQERGDPAQDRTARDLHGEGRGAPLPGAQHPGV